MKLFDFNIIFLTSNIFSKDNPDPFGFNNAFDGLLSGLYKIINVLYGILTSIMEAVYMFYNSLTDITAWIDNLIDGLITGNIDGLPVLEAIGTYRYLVGDLVFYLTYFTIALGCSFTIYRLCRLIIKEIKTSYTNGNSFLGKLLQFK